MPIASHGVREERGRLEKRSTSGSSRVGDAAYAGALARGADAEIVGEKTIVGENVELDDDGAGG